MNNKNKEEDLSLKGYSDVYIKYLKNGKKSIMSEQDVYKHHKKIYGNRDISELKNVIKKLKKKREDEFNDYIKKHHFPISDTLKAKIKKSILDEYPYELIFKYQY